MIGCQLQKMPDRLDYFVGSQVELWQLSFGNLHDLMAYISVYLQFAEKEKIFGAYNNAWKIYIYFQTTVSRICLIITVCKGTCWNFCHCLLEIRTALIAHMRPLEDGAIGIPLCRGGKSYAVINNTHQQLLVWSRPVFFGGWLFIRCPPFWGWSITHAPISNLQLSLLVHHLKLCGIISLVCGSTVSGENRCLLTVLQ